jgi:hypothetical protein
MPLGLADLDVNRWPIELARMPATKDGAIATPVGRLPGPRSDAWRWPAG